MEDLTIRPTIKSQLANIFLAASLATLAFRGWGLDWTAAVLISKVLAALSFFLVLVIIHAIYNYKYVLTDDFILAMEGILSLQLLQTKVRYEDIKFVEVDKSILGRILDYGNVYIASAATSDIEITLRNISSPFLFKEFIMGQVGLKRQAKQPKEGLSDLKQEDFKNQTKQGGLEDVKS